MAVATHFTMVGFDVDLQNQAALTRSVAQMMTSCTTDALSKTQVICLQRDASGAEIRVGLVLGGNNGVSIATLNPGFLGEGRTTVKVTGDVSDPDSKPFEVTISAQFDGENTPLAFDLADPEQARRFASGDHLTLDISAFSSEPTIFANADAFLKSQSAPDRKVKFASNYFIPSGMFFEHVGGAMPDNAKMPIAYADFAGTVLRSELRTNVVGQKKFWWALVKTYDDATIDVVMDPSTIAKDPAPGTIVTGRFWLSAHAIETAKQD